MDEKSQQVLNPTYKKLDFLDGLRGLAALYVMIGHARYLLWEGFSSYLKHPEDYSLINKILTFFFALFRYGHEVVLFFFVLSGFVIHLKYAVNFTKSSPSKFSFSEYLGKRVKRIYPPFIFALLLTLLLDYIGIKCGFAIYHGGTSYSTINDSLAGANRSAITFIGNLLFLHENYFSIFGSNGPAWSLKYEWWFYMVYPLLLLTASRHIIYPTIIITTLFVLSFFPKLWPETLLPDIFSMMITWWLGVILAEIYVRRIRISLKWLSPLMLALLFNFFPFTLTPVWHDIVTALFFTGMIAVLMSFTQSSLIMKMLARLKLLGDISYTLYITHFPILVLLSGILMHYGNDQLPSHFGFVLLGIAVTLGLAYIFHFITEVPFIRKKKTTSPPERC